MKSQKKRKEERKVRQGSLAYFSPHPFGNERTNAEPPDIYLSYKFLAG